MRLKDIAYYVGDSISSDLIEEDQYVTTDSLLQNKEGRILASNLPPQTCSLTHFMPGDILIANIRPYLKKVWKADIEGGCSKDVLVIRAIDGHNPEYIYALSLQDSFFENAMLGNKGTQMPRGDKDKIMDFPVFAHSKAEKQSIGNLIGEIQNKISLNTRMNAELEAMAKQLYDYWFVQFDFPDENGNPYKSSGGKMAYNSTLKREIPAGWEVNSIINIIEPLERGISYSSEDINKNIGIPMFNLACYSKLGEYRTGELKTFSGYVKSENKTYPYDMLIACTDMTQDADIIGRPILVTEEYDSYVYSMDLIKITPKEIDKFYLYYSLRTPFYHKYIKPFASGTNVKHLKVDGIENYIISIPPAYLQSLFEKIVSNLKKKEMKIINENIDLTHLRDSLLPMLMNGQVTVE